jgi:hypothetical protein
VSTVPARSESRPDSSLPLNDVVVYVDAMTATTETTPPDEQLVNRGNQNSDHDSSSDQYNCMNVDSDSSTNISYETDITEGGADME